MVKNEKPLLAKNICKDLKMNEVEMLSSSTIVAESTELEETESSSFRKKRHQAVTHMDWLQEVN